MPDAQTAVRVYFDLIIGSGIIALVCIFIYAIAVRDGNKDE